VALAVRQRGLAKRVIGVVRSPERVGRVEACGVVDEVTADAVAACGGADLVVVATPVDTIARWALEAAQHAAPDALVTDAGSTKAAIIAAVEAGWPSDGDGLAFVGAHPLAGDHRTGPEASQGDLFDGATTILTPTSATPPKALAAARALWEGMGSVVVEMTPDEHDRAVALTSHVPHVAASAVAAVTPEAVLGYTASGWADTTRVAAGSPSLWREILLANSRPVSEGLRRLSQELDAYAAALDRQDGVALETLLEEGRRIREARGRDALGS
jgi:prephenate dehydrogenase